MVFEVKYDLIYILFLWQINMENKILENIWIEIETEENIKYCKILKKIIIWIIISFIFVFLLILSWVNIISFADWRHYYNFFETILIYFIYLLNISWTFWIPIYAIYLKKKLLITKKCFKKTLIIWWIPIILPLLLFWWCVIIFSILSI